MVSLSKTSNLCKTCGEGPNIVKAFDSKVSEEGRMSKPIQTLSKRLFWQKRGRNIVAVSAIILTTVMFTVLFVLSQSMSKNLVEMTFRQTGYDAQVSFKSITTEQADLIASCPEVAEIGESIILGLAENKELSGKQVEIRWGDVIYAKHSFAMPDIGTLPQSEDEIALDTLILDRLGIPHELGQNISLRWRKDLSGNEVLTSTFKLCGYWKGNQSVHANSADPIKIIGFTATTVRLLIVPTNTGTSTAPSR